MEEQLLKSHFDTVASGAEYASYEERRWKSSPKMEEQYRATEDFINHVVTPLAQTAHHITELGPGPGTWTHLLRTAAPNTMFTLLDISKEMLVRAAKVLPEAPSPTLIEGDFTRVTLPDNTCDFFFSSRAIEYVTPKQDAIHRVYAHLTSGGAAALITKMPKPLLNTLSGRTQGAVHIGQISPRELKGLLRHEGAIHVHLYPVTFSVPLLRSARADRLIRTVFGSHRLNPISAFFAESYGVTFAKP